MCGITEYPTCTLLTLPEDVLLRLIKGLHIRDLLNLRSTNTTLHQLIDVNTSVWTSVSFEGTWPSPPNLVHFKRAANHYNLQALVKLGLAYLYNEGLPMGSDGRRLLPSGLPANGEKVADIFCKVEHLMGRNSPLTWIFIRPPWPQSTTCCKQVVFQKIQETAASSETVPQLQICVAKTLQLLEGEDNQAEARSWLQQAVAKGSSLAEYLLWQQQHSELGCDAAMQLQSLRQLRAIASHNCTEAQLALCQLYAQGKYGGIHQHQAAVFVHDFLQASKATDIHSIYRNRELTHSMRYILLDWLVEVATMKEFSSVTIHCAVNMVDRYLKSHNTTRSRLQLLAVSALVLCSRFLGKDIITIREAAWLTDNTYKYEDVVRMMGEITAALHGHIWEVTTWDYLQIVGQLAQNDKRTQCLSEYIGELCLLQSDLGVYPQSQLAASCVLLARLTLRLEWPWPNHLHVAQFTGFSLQDLATCTLHILHKCFGEEAPTDHRDVVLKAVHQRYAQEEFLKVSQIEMLDAEDLAMLLGASDLQFASSPPRPGYDMSSLITSPSRAQRLYNFDIDMDLEREHAATPSLDCRNSEDMWKHRQLSVNKKDSLPHFNLEESDGGDSYSSGLPPYVGKTMCNTKQSSSNDSGTSISQTMRQVWSIPASCAHSWNTSSLSTCTKEQDGGKSSHPVPKPTNRLLRSVQLSQKMRHGSKDCVTLKLSSLATSTTSAGLSPLVAATTSTGLYPLTASTGALSISPLVTSGTTSPGTRVKRKSSNQLGKDTKIYRSVDS